MAGLVVKKENQSSWVRYIKQRISRNKNFVGFISGPTGIGKSWASLSICQKIDPSFNEDKIAFSGKELMEIINKGDLKKGSCMVFEEAGVNQSSKNWQSTANKMLNFLFQTFRHRNFVLIMNSPYMDFVDASTRKLFHAEIPILSVNKKEGYSIAKPQLIQYNSRYRKFYYKYLRVATKKGVSPIQRWKIHSPTRDLIREYEIKKREFTDRLNKEIVKELEGKKKEDRPRARCPYCQYEWTLMRNKEPSRCPRCAKCIKKGGILHPRPKESVCNESNQSFNLNYKRGKNEK